MVEKLQEPALAEVDARVGPPEPALDERLIHEAVRARLFGGGSGEAARPLQIGRFAVLRKLGAGGMGVVYLAYDEQLDRKIAVKLLHPQPRAGPAEARFKREAVALGRLSHPNVVQVHEVGEHEGATFVAMEFVTGPTLAKWLSEAPALSERLAILLQCGRGLEAAHAAGLVHRDFKPDNVIVGEDGRARVLDFGLARELRSEPSVDGSSSSGSTPGAEPSTAQQSTAESPSALRETLTHGGALVGTPAYMAPEQLRGESCDARADQFAFCVTAYESLFGERPFCGRSVGALLQDMREMGERSAGLTGKKATWRTGRATAEARVREGSATLPDVRVPASVRDPIIRGLAFEPEQRWPSMSALLDELEFGVVARARTRKSRVFGALFGVAVAAGLAIPTLLDTGPSCEIDPSVLSGAWDDARRRALRDGLARSGLDAAQTTGATIEARLDDWSARFIAAQRSACEATHVSGMQSPALLDQRLACLERKRRDLGILVELWIELWADADRNVLEQSESLLAALPSLDGCMEPGGPSHTPSQPETAELRAQVESARDALERVELLQDVGKLELAARILDELETQAAALAYPPLALEHRTLVGHLELTRGRPDQGAVILQAAAHEARRLGLVEHEADIRTLLAYGVAGSWSKPELEAMVIAEAEAAVAALEHTNDRREIDLAQARALLAVGAEDHERALASFTRACELARRHDPDNAELCRIEMGSAHMQLGQLDEARRDYEAALARARVLFGERSPTAATIFYNLGLLALAGGEYERAQTLFQRAIAIRVEVFGEASAPVGEARMGLAKVLLIEGSNREAQALLEATVAGFEAELGPVHEFTGRAYVALGVARFYTEDFEASIDAYERAALAYAHVFGEQHSELGLLRSNVGESLVALGRHGQALVAFDEATEMFERAPPASPSVLALPYKGRGQSLLALGEPEAALDNFEQALQLMDKARDEPLELAAVCIGLAHTLDALDRDPARVRALATRAADQYAQLEHAAEAAAIEAWLGTLEPDQDAGVTTSPALTEPTESAPSSSK